MRWGGPRYREDDVYVESGALNIRILQREARLTEDSRVLDIGCGAGRLLTGFLATYGKPPVSYVGLDVVASAIDWAKSELVRDAVAFHLLDVFNERYSPSAKGSAGTVRLPVEPDSFDVVALLSVFSHMRLRDIEPYLREIRRALAPAGRVYLTIFVEHGVALEEENPVGYHRDWDGPLHCVRINRHHFENLAYEAGLAVERFHYRHTSDGQSSYVLARGDQPQFQARVVR